MNTRTPKPLRDKEPSAPLPPKSAPSMKAIVILVAVLFVSLGPIHAGRTRRNIICISDGKGLFSDTILYRSARPSS